MAIVTVVIPCYNSEEYIAKCINSIEKQTFDSVEIICIDDCSSDHTVDILCELKKRVSHKLTIIQNTTNLGPAKSRNKGIELVTSKYVAFCDADDWYDERFLQEMISTMEKFDAALSFCGYTVVDERGHKRYHRLETSQEFNKISDAMKLDVDSLCMMVVRSNLMKETLLPDIRNGEDMAVIPLLIAKAEGSVVVKDCLYNYYRRSSSASQKPTIKVVQELEKSYEYIQEHFPNGYELELEYIGIRNLLYAAIITLFSFSYDVKTASTILDVFEEKHSDWKKNNFINAMPKYKKIVLRLLAIRCFWGIRIISLIRNKMTGIE